MPSPRRRHETQPTTGDRAMIMLVLLHEAETWTCERNDIATTSKKLLCGSGHPRFVEYSPKKVKAAATSTPSHVVLAANYC